MSQSLSTAELLDQFAERLELNWICGRQEAQKRRLSAGSPNSRPDLVGYLSLVHPNRIQILGREELDWLDRLDAKQRWETIAQICDARPGALIVAGSLEMGSDLEELARETGTPLATSGRTAPELVEVLDYQVSRALARSTTLHGVFMEIFTIGVLISGEPGSGKSELALELINRGHRLIADDSPLFTQITPDTIEGSCPPVLADCLEVRGLGVLNVRRMFGDAAVKSNKFLRLILHLHIPESAEKADNDRLTSQSESLPVLDMEIRRIHLPVLPGRNLAVIAEAAVRDWMLQMKGFDAAAEFVERHGRIMRDRD